MKETEPKIHLIAKPQLDEEAIRKYLQTVDGEDWLDRVNEHKTTTPGERLVEFAGRLCYRSWKPGLNPNVTKVREDSAEYLGNLLSLAHGSVLEHINYTFVFQDVSRVVTHELVRHRVGVAISQESLRYVRLTDIGFRIPPALESMRRRIMALIEDMEDFQLAAANTLISPHTPFSDKKMITSAMRRLAPIGLSTSLVWTANVRTLRHTLASRTAPGAEEEIRIVFDKVGWIMRKECPLLFSDFELEPADPGPPAWVPTNPVAGQTRV